MKKASFRSDAETATKRLTFEEILNAAWNAASNEVSLDKTVTTRCVYADRDGEVQMFDFDWRDESEEVKEMVLREIQRTFYDHGVVWYAFVVLRKEGKSDEVGFFIGTRFEFGSATAQIAEGKLLEYVKTPEPRESRFGVNFIEQRS